MLFVYRRRVPKRSVIFCTIATATAADIRPLSELHVVCHKTGTHERNIVEADRHSSSKRESIIKYHTVLFHVPKNCVCVIYDAIIYVRVYTVDVYYI